jgi:DNA-binding SARP family transcriptional activator
MGNERLELRGDGQRALLAALLLRADESVMIDVLAQDLWGEDVGVGATKRLQVAVSRLRRALGPLGARLRTVPGGYVLYAADALDARRFEQLLAAGRERIDAGRNEVAARLLEESLLLWRGPVLLGARVGPFLDAEVGRLDDQRLVATEVLNSARLSLGRGSELASELQLLTRRYPAREVLHKQLMLALYQSGRQADALAAFHRARSWLCDNLGIEPGHELRALHQQILRQDTASS